MPSKKRRSGASERQQPADGADSRRASPTAGKRSPRDGKAANKRTLKGVDDGTVFILSHPLRVRMIAALNEGDASPSDLAKKLECSTQNTAYHMRCLLRYEFVELVDSELVGSAVKKIYRAKMEVNLPKKIFEQFPPAVQQLLVVQAFVNGFSDIEVALMCRVFQERPESHASWSHLDVDAQAWMELVDLADRTLDEAAAIRDASTERSGLGNLVASLNLSLFVLPEDTESIDMRAGEIHKPLNGETTVRHEPEAGA